MPNLQHATISAPADLGYAMPAEWEKHEATWLAWPHHEADWPDKMDAVRWVYGEMVSKISPGEIVRVLVRHKAEQKIAASHLKRAGCDLRNVRFILHPTNRSWMRDSGPIFVKKSPKSTHLRCASPRQEVQSPKLETAIVHFHFNAWAKHDDWQKDRKVPELAARLLGKKLFHAVRGHDNSTQNSKFKIKNFVLEGGGIEVNGRGTLLTTEECYLHPKIQVRNSGMTWAQYNETFRKYLGAKNVFWLRKGPAGDDTHGHIDDICRFVNPKTLVPSRKRTNATSITVRSRKTGNASRIYGSKMVPSLKLCHYRCLRRFILMVGACRQAMRTFTSATPASSCRRSMTRTTASLWVFWASCSRIVRWLASMPLISCSVPARSIA